LGSELTPDVLRNVAENDDLESVLTLNISIDTDVTSISELANHVPNLFELKLTAPSYLPTLRKIGTFMNLKVLWASAVGLESLDGASGMPNLTELYVSYNQITELSPLAFFTKLEILDLESNLIESGLDLRFLSLCPKLSNVTMRECPIADLYDYRKIVKNRLPPICTLDDDDESPIIDTDKMMSIEDSNFIKELVAEGLLDEDELLADEPLSRPFTAIGIRPKTGRLTPKSPGANRPRTALNLFKKETTFSGRNSSVPTNSSELTSGAVMQGNRGLLARRRSRPKSASSLTNRTEKTPENIKFEIEQQLMSWKSEKERNAEVNILTLDHDKYEASPEPIPERSTLVRSIRTPPSEEPIKKDESELAPTIEFRDIPSSSSIKSPAPVDALSSSLRDVLKFKDIKKSTELELNSRAFRSRQEELLAEGRILKQKIASSGTRTTITAPIIKHQSSNRKQKLTQN